MFARSLAWLGALIMIDVSSTLPFLDHLVGAAILIGAVAFVGTVVALIPANVSNLYLGFLGAAVVITLLTIEPGDGLTKVLAVMILGAAFTGKSIIDRSVVRHSEVTSARYQEMIATAADAILPSSAS